MEMTETAGQELPETLYLPPSRARWVFSLVLSTIIVAVNLYMFLVYSVAGLGIMAAVIAIPGIAAAVQLIPGSAGLWLDRRGFTSRIFWTDRRREWKEITPILSSQTGLLQLVGYNRAGDAPNKPREVLPDTYGISANELAEIMNHWRDTAIKAG
ncbi:hypothetical protein IZ6_06150 [Terrihabitans soli]|uniref:PH domain-containing protein n=2 Tax=Terrihabitans soli TaxID=708113 RepID=A0A6S6QSJ7_9HYPH|nr:hypothetical protein IZ6_06150 [Terrihabitans soli]